MSDNIAFWDFDPNGSKVSWYAPVRIFSRDIAGTQTVKYTPYILNLLEDFYEVYSFDPEIEDRPQISFSMITKRHGTPVQLKHKSKVETPTNVLPIKYSGPIRYLVIYVTNVPKGVEPILCQYRNSKLETMDDTNLRLHRVDKNFGRKARNLRNQECREFTFSICKEQYVSPADHTVFRFFCLVTGPRIGTPPVVSSQELEERVSELENKIVRLEKENRDLKRQRSESSRSVGPPIPKRTKGEKAHVNYTSDARTAVLNDIPKEQCPQQCQVQQLQPQLQEQLHQKEDQPEATNVPNSIWTTEWDDRNFPPPPYSPTEVASWQRNSVTFSSSEDEVEEAEEASSNSVPTFYL